MEVNQIKIKKSNISNRYIGTIYRVFLKILTHLFFIFEVLNVC